MEERKQGRVPTSFPGRKGRVWLCWWEGWYEVEQHHQLSTRANARLCGLAATGTAIVHLAPDLCVRADVLEGGGVAVVRVDADDLAAIVRGGSPDNC